ncbi:MAG: TonB-dependent receptor [Tannerellaceae bacterium]|nr:TonB-dependent receptor [Tannerellaceae bacterium]
MYRFNSKNILAGINKVLVTVALLLIAHLMQAQADKVLNGRVVDELDRPIAGAIVNVAEETRLTLTDQEGYFQLTGLSPTDELIISCVGYKEISVSVEFVEGFKIVLEDDLDMYEKTIATPFSRTPRKFVVNSMSTVTGAELEKHPVTVLQNAFTSTLTGVQTYEANSEPGWSETELYIRGLRTMNAGARSPLIIVDNVERDLSFLDAYPIETISILKDAAATAIYGMRGANGVVLVTTKRGNAGKTKIDFTQEIGFQTLSGLPRQQNSYNYALTVNQARYLDGLQPLYSDQEIEYYRQAVEGTLDPSLQYKYVNTDWYDVMLRDRAPQYKTNLQISGGNQTARYYVSFTYLRQEGMYNTDWTEYNDGYSTQHVLNRYNLRSNIDVDVTSFLNLSLDLGGRIDNISQPGGNRRGEEYVDVWQLWTFGTGENLPTNRVLNPDGSFSVPSDNVKKNAAALLSSGGIDYNRRRNLYSNLTATGNLDFITPGLKVKAIIGFDSYNTFNSVQEQFYDSFEYDPDTDTYTRKSTARALGNPTATLRDMNYNVNLIGSVNYNRTFNSKHTVDGQLMVRTYRNVMAGSASSNRYMSYGGILNYIYDSRYIAQVTAAYMGNDNFAPGSRYGFFPGLSLGWVLSEESWLKNSPVDMLKLRASIGRAGESNGMGRYPYQSSYSFGGGYNFGTSQAGYAGVYESTTGNSNIKWELSDMLNVGVDFDLFGRKLYGQVDVFKEWRSNILVTRSTVPEGLYGASVPQDSYGKAETKGIEVMLGHQGKVGDVKYFLEGMLTFNRSKMTEIDEVEKDYDYQRLTGLAIKYGDLADTGNWLRYEKVQWASDPALIPTSHQDAIDHPEKYPYQAGMQLGNAVFYDANGDRIIDAYDQVPYNYTRIPELIPSVTVGFEWKGFDARVMLTAYLNRTVETRENTDHSFGWGGATTHEVTKTWGYYTDDPTDPRNINALYPRLSTSFSDVDRLFPFNTNSVWLRNGNFLSLRNIEVGYSLPAKLIAKAHMTQCRFYFSGYNLWTWSDFENGFDPESPVNYIWQYPKTKSFSVGVKVGF